MNPLLQTQPVSRRRIWIARAIAMIADAVQVGIFPFFLEGMLSPADAILDVIVAALLTLLVGWHIAFLPAFVVEALPFADLAPSWTIAIFIATRGKHPTAEPRELPEN